jgi:hypothetical protein
MKTTIFKKIKPIVFICILSFLSAFFFNELNIRQLPPDQLRAAETVITNDDVSYINPPGNYLQAGEWKENNRGTIGYFIRPPGYGILYLLFLKLAGYPMSLKLLKIFQLMLFSVSVYWFYSISLSIIKNKTIALTGAAIYGVSPFMTGFLYYTLTEGITPQLILLFVFLLVKAHDGTNPRTKNTLYLLASIVFAYLIIVRPVLGVFGFLIPFFLWKEFKSKTVKNIFAKCILFSAIAFSFISLWEIRNYRIAGHYVGLHPIYYEDGNSIYREPFKEFWNFAGGWAEKPDDGFAYMVPFWEAAIKGDTSQKYISNILISLPSEVVMHFRKERLTAVFRDYQSAILIQKPYYEKNLPMPMGSYPEEQKVVKDLQQLDSEYRSYFWFTDHVSAPLKVFRLMAFNSNLSLFIFQKTFRGNFLMEIFRYLFYGLHILCFLAIFFNLFFLRKQFLLVSIVSVGPLIYIFYLCYFQRGIEDRYSLPVLPLLMIGLLNLVWVFYKKIRKIPG